MASKTDPRVCAYGDVDELNAQIAVVLALVPLNRKMKVALATIQNELFDLGADLSNPVVADPKVEPLRIVQENIDQLETWCDEFSADLAPLRSFVLPGGCPVAAQLNVCRAMARRAERSAWQAAEIYGLADENDDAGTEHTADERTADEQAGGLNPLALKYLNRLSDLLFIFGRHANQEVGAPETLWVPGGKRKR